MKDNFKIWDYDKDYGEVLYKRATGTLPEMECSKSFCEILRKVYRPGMKLLDVGCGAGHYLRSLINRIDKSINYTGIDATEKYINLAKQAFGKRARFLRGDINNLPFNDNSYDIVACNNVILHLPPPPILPIRELIRISSRFVIIRTVIGKRNYIVKEIRIPEELSNAQIEEKNNNFSYYNYFNFYTTNYISQILTHINSNLKFEFVDDNNYSEFDNTEHLTNTATKVINGMQISGNLLLDWKFIVIDKGN